MRLKRCSFCGATNLCESQKCRRCGLGIEKGYGRCIQESLAFLVAAIIFYLPANIYPVLQSTAFGSMEKSTIIGGVLHLWQMGDYPIAIVIFLASVAVPIAKFVILFYLLLEIASKHRSDPKKLAILYHVVEVSGPWSLVDVFVVVILAAVVHFVSVSIIPGLGATSFALMVFFTLLASRSLKICLAGAQCEI